MNKQPSQDRTQWMKRMKIRRSLLAVFSLPIRLLLAFVFGWFLSFIVQSALAGLDASLFLIFPLLLGILVPLTVRRRNPNLIPLSIVTGLLVVAGIYAYWFPLAVRDDAQNAAASAASGSYSHVGNEFEVQLLNLFLPYGIVLVLPGAVITGLVIKRNLKRETRRETVHHLAENTDKKGSY